MPAIAYAPYPRVGALGASTIATASKSGPVSATGGWTTPTRELVAEFTKDQKHAPTEAEHAVLARLAERNNAVLRRMTGGHSPSRVDQMDFNTAQGLINFYLVNGRGPDHGDPVGPPRGGPEVEALINAATDSVPDKSWIKSALHTITAPVRAVEDVASKAEHAVSKIPVIGDVTHVVSEVYTAPFRIADNIASGERLDHVALSALKDQLKIAKDVAPYAQTVVAFVPGVGTGVAAAIGAGAALAEGQSITEAAKAAIRGAIPGGALAQGGFDLAMKVAAGENVGKAALETARAQLPAGAQQAFDVGLAVATGEKLQTALTKGLTSLAGAQLQTVLAAGAKAVASTPGLADALKNIAPGSETEGFQLAAGLLSHSGMNERALTAVRSQLPADVVRGFDAALKTQAPHVSWLANVVRAPVPAAKAAPAAPTGPKILEPPKKTAAAPSKPATGPIVHEPPKKASGPIVHEPPKTAATKFTGKYGPYPKMAKTGVSAPPHGPHGPHGGGGHHGHGGGRRGAPRIFRGGRAVPGWDDYYPLPAEVITTTETCRTWSDLVPIPPSMVQAVKTAIGSSGGRPTTMRADNGSLYLFTVEDGGIAARRCVSFGVGGWWDDAWNDWSAEVKDLWRGG
jgi:hypothetical protein